MHLLSSHCEGVGKETSLVMLLGRSSSVTGNAGRGFALATLAGKLVVVLTASVYKTDAHSPPTLLSTTSVQRRRDAEGKSDEWSS